MYNSYTLFFACFPLTKVLKCFHGRNRCSSYVLIIPPHLHTISFGFIRKFSCQHFPKALLYCNFHSLSSFLSLNLGESAKLSLTQLDTQRVKNRSHVCIRTYVVAISLSDALTSLANVRNSSVCPRPRKCGRECVFVVYTRGKQHQQQHQQQQRELVGQATNPLWVDNPTHLTCAIYTAWPFVCERVSGNYHSMRLPHLMWERDTHRNVVYYRCSENSSAAQFYTTVCMVCIFSLGDDTHFCGRLVVCLFGQIRCRKLWVICTELRSAYMHIYFSKVQPHTFTQIYVERGPREGYANTHTERE